MVEITSKENTQIKNIIKLNKNSKQRREQGLFVVEGIRICEDAMLSNAVIECALVTNDAVNKYSDFVDKLVNYAKTTYTVSEKIFNLISDTKTPQGVLCVIKTLDKHSLFDKIKYNGKLLALENIQDPTNMGTILRTAEAVGIDAIVLSFDCCDIYSPKVARGSMGAIFRLPYIIVNSISDFIAENQDITSYAAVVDDNVDKLNDITFKEPCLVVIGNEGNGLKQETIDSCTKSITIPMKGRAESLNAGVAASIIMWEMIK